MDACDGRPVWLASVSYWPHGRNLPLERWGRGIMILARRGIAELLDGVGDPDMERGFAMVATLCAHRGVSDEEMVGLPEGRAVHLAGAGVKEMWRTPLFPQPGLTLQRCEQGIWIRRGNVRLPGECGECPPCIARQELAASR